MLAIMCVHIKVLCIISTIKYLNSHASFRNLVQFSTNDSLHEFSPPKTNFHDRNRIYCSQCVHFYNLNLNGMNIMITDVIWNYMGI